MKHLSLAEFTTTARGSCVYCSRKEASQRFFELGMYGETALCHVKDDKDQTFVLWINDDGKNIAFLPLFINDKKLSDLHYADIVPVTKTSFMYYRHDDHTGISYLAICTTDDIIIRQIRIFADQIMIENYCSTQGIKETGIYLCKMETVQDSETVAVCWSIEYENPNELDENEQPQQYETLLPVDLAEADLLNDINTFGINNVYLHEGDTFEAQKVLYRVMKDENGKFFITKDLFTPKKAVSALQVQESEPQKENDDEEAEEPACRIVPFHFNKKLPSQ